MRYIFTPVGSGGDVRPFVAIARKMVALGHTATVIAAEPFDALARSAGLDFISVWPAEEYHREILNPDLWHPHKGVRLVMRILTANLQPVWDAVERASQGGDCVLVAHSLAFATRAFAEKHDVPCATLHLQPNVIRTHYDQPIVIPGVNMNLVPRFMRGAFWKVVDRLVTDPVIAPQLNSWRATHQLPPLRNVFAGGVHSPDLVLALFPEWFAARQPDWPQQARHVGFPLVRSADDSIEPELAEWLQHGEPPIVFTAGTANRHATEFFDAAIEATNRLGKRALLLTKWRDQIREKLPPAVHWSAWAPLGEVLPHSTAFVHHGGIGSCADGFAAGVPQLLMPMAFDQHDNAARVERLGVGLSLSPSRFDGRRVSSALEKLLSDERVAEACRRYAALMSRSDGVGEAAASLHELGVNPGVRTPSSAL